MFARTVLRSVRIAGRRAAARNLHASAPLRANTHTAPQSSGSDLPWLIGSVAFTVPAAYYLLTSGSPNHEAVHHANQQKKDAVAVERSSNFNTGAVERAEAAVQKAKDTTAADVKETASSAASAAASAASHPQETAAAAKDAAAGAYDAAKDKASELVSGASKTDAKAAAADAADSAKDKAAGAVDAAKEKAGDVADAAKSAVSRSDADAHANPSVRDPGDSTQRPVDIDATSGRMSAKQEGLSNVDTFHTLLQTERGQAISKKGEGVHDSAKLKGTVSVDSKPSPPPENENKDE